MALPDTLLKIRDLRLVIETMQGRFSVLNGVDLEIRESEIVGLVGESGSGKSTLALATIGLIPRPPAKVLEGSRILFKNEDLLGLTENEMEAIRGTGISMIFQEPLTSLNPLFTVGDQLGESVVIALERGREAAPIPGPPMAPGEARPDGKGKTVATTRSRPDDGKKLNKEEVRLRVVAWLRRVGIPDPEHSYTKYPHEMSGGMRQRVMIAMAMEAKPSLMLADEPTSALDVTTQAQILGLIRSLKNEFGTSVLFISHDLAVVAQIADRVAVMYAGMIVEEGAVGEMFESPRHPYTQALLASFPGEQSKDEKLQVIPGSVPSLKDIPPGCPFHPRCLYAMEKCKAARPVPKEVGADHRVACWLY